MSKIKEEAAEKNGVFQGMNKDNWHCFNCQHSLYFKKDEAAPKKCPKCGSDRVFDSRLKTEN